MLSMTGYGKAQIVDKGFDLTIELRSLNNRYLDISLKIPLFLSSYEPLLRDMIKKSIIRGKLNVNIDVRKIFTADKQENLNFEQAKEIYNKIELLRKTLAIDDSTKLEHLLHFPEIFEENQQDYATDSFKILLSEAMNQALNALNNMRESEGSHLKKDILKRIDFIVKVIKKIKVKAKGNVKNEFNKHLSRIEELLEQKQIDRERLEQEIAIISDKVDISEEITRMESHIKHFKEVLKKENELGKKLTFILQEMNREANTINNKATETEINHSIILVKQEIEKIREQAQNIE